MGIGPEVEKQVTFNSHREVDMMPQQAWNGGSAIWERTKKKRPEMINKRESKTQWPKFETGDEVWVFDLCCR